MEERVVVENSFSDWKPVLQGSVPDPLRFVVYINHRNVNGQGLISMLVDDTKVGNIMDSEDG